MTEQEFSDALLYLGTVVPHGIFPGVKGWETLPVFATEEAWDAYQWNPPQYGREYPQDDDPDIFEPLQELYSTVDPDASPKPTWEELTGALASWQLANKRVDLLEELGEACKIRIIMAYGADDWQDEIQKRLRGDTTAEQDTKRDKLRATHKKFTTWVNDPDRTLAELEAFVPNWET